MSAVLSQSSNKNVLCLLKVIRSIYKVPFLLICPRTQVLLRPSWSMADIALGGKLPWTSMRRLMDSSSAL
jgi:hypothetical protein